jgi:hypothetical protein
MDFFALSDHDAHALLCDCHYRGAMTGRGLAKHVRAHARRAERRAAWARTFKRIFGWGR